jgi:hypothetical protein
LLIRQQDLERQLLAGLKARVLHLDVVAYTLKPFEEELEKALATRSQGDADMRRQTGEIERGIANQLRALRDGYSPAITADLAKLEHQLAGVQARLKTSDPRTVKSQIRNTPRFVESRLEVPPIEQLTPGLAAGLDHSCCSSLARETSHLVISFATISD